jgi:hypothetical protein
LGALFGVSKSTAHQVVHEEFQRVAYLIFAYVSMDSFFMKVPPGIFPTAMVLLIVQRCKLIHGRIKHFLGRKTCTL